MILCIYMFGISMCMYRLYTEVNVSTGFIKLRVEGTRFDKSSRNHTEVYNRLLPANAREIQ